LVRTAAHDPSIDAAGAHRGWWSVAGGISGKGGQVTAVARQSSMLDAFCIGTDGYVYTAAWSQAVDGGNGFRGWWRIGTLKAPVGSRVTPIALASNQLQIFVIDQSGRVQTSYWDGNANGTWSAWTHVLGGVAAAGTEAAASKRGNGNISLTVVGTDGRMYTAEGTLNSWAGWWDRQMVGSSPFVQLSHVLRDAANTDYVGVASNGRVYHRTYNTSSGWTNWTQIGTQLTGAGRRAVVVSRSSTTLNAFMAGNDRKIYTASYSTASGWSAWTAIAGLTAGYATQVAATARGTSALHVYAGASGNVYHTSWTSAGGWKAWNALPANL
jgi:hypothetical protein